jgi:hypothetical protein
MARRVTQVQQQNDDCHCCLLQGDDVTRSAHAVLMQQLQLQTPAAVSGAALMSLIESTRMLPFGVDRWDLCASRFDHSSVVKRRYLPVFCTPAVD